VSPGRPANPVKPGIDFRRVEAEEMAPLQVRDPPLGDQAPYMPDSHAEELRHVLDS
jgi:hypothetical protein